MIPENIQKEQYEKGGNFPMAWEMSADELLAAADVLKQKRTTVGPVSVGSPIPLHALSLSIELMLRGYAIECLLKGLWVSLGNEITEDGKLKKIPNVNMHDLVKISEIVNLSLSDKEKTILARLKIYTTSMGRYPIPTNWQHTKIQRWPDGSESFPGIWTSPTDYEILENFIERIKKEIRKNSKKPPTMKRLA